MPRKNGFRSNDLRDLAQRFAPQLKPTCDLGRQERNLKIHVAKKKKNNLCCDQWVAAAKHIAPMGAQFSFHADICYKTNFEFVWIQLMITQVKNELADALEAETGGAQNLFHGIA